MRLKTQKTQPLPRPGLQISLMQLALQQRGENDISQKD